MIVVKLMGGLGNQMFQYAFARHLSIKHSTSLKLDLSYLNDRSPRENFIFRNFELCVFDIKASIADEKDINKFKKELNKKILDHVSLYLPFHSDNFYLREPHFHFFKQAINAPENSYIDGYWQSEKYFKEISEQLKKDFILTKPLSDKAQYYKEKMLKNQSVSIHVRRADYVTQQGINRYHICSENYYYDAMKIIGDKVSFPEFYIFSDEPDWFKKNILTDFPVEYIESKSTTTNYEDIHLMSFCKHNIIANSTFSWWGAWLNENQNKTVIAPEKWFEDNSKNAKDLLPKRWIKV